MMMGVGMGFPHANRLGLGDPRIEVRQGKFLEGFCYDWGWWKSCFSNIERGFARRFAWNVTSRGARVDREQQGYGDRAQLLF